VTDTEEDHGLLGRLTGAEREEAAERLADRLDAPLTAAGVLFTLLVLVDIAVDVGPGMARFFEISAWLLWAVFVGEFVLRLSLAPSTSRFLRRNWWQLIFLAVPFLRFLRPLARLRIPRVGRVISASVRSTRTAGRRLSGRATWLGMVTAIVVLGASQIVFVYGDYPNYAEALHAAALLTTTGEPLGQAAPVAKVLDVVLGVYSVIVFAALAGMLGAYFLERRGADGTDAAVRPPGPRQGL
jgi:voltage-gated potassium channel